MEKRKILPIIVLALVGIAVLSLLHHELHRAVLRLYNLPTGPNEISDKMITYFRRRSFDFPILAVNPVIGMLGALYGMSRDWIRKARAESRLAQEKLKADLDLLRSQINPHFLFNALNNIYAIAQRNGEEETGEAIMKLSGLLRHMIYDSGAAEIGLDRELEHVRTFIDVARLRFAGDEKVDIALAEKGDLGSVEIAPLILIPFVENAVKHGLGSRGQGYVRIGVEVADGRLRFSVRNPVLNKGEPILKHSGIGLDNVKKRLGLLYPDRHAVEIKEEDGIFDVALTIRLRR